MAMIKRICKYCKKEFDKHPSVIKRGGGIFCSTVCSSKWKVNNRQVIDKIKCKCEWCGSEVMLYPSIAKTFKFCSRKCKGEAKRVIKIKRVCKGCGGEFEIYESSLKHGRGNFCSQVCEWAHVAELKRKPSIKCKCIQCGLEIDKNPSSAKLFKFCSLKCKANYQKQFVGELNRSYNHIDRKCETCGKIISRPPSLFENKSHIFCNTKCMGKWMSDNLSGENSPIFKPKVKCVCKYCGGEFYRHESTVKNGNGIFCSRSCLGKWNGDNFRGMIRTTRINVVCDYCKNVYLLTEIQHNKSNLHFCSRKCYMDYKSEIMIGENSPLWNKVKQICLNCGNEFDAIKSQVEYGYAKYCSRDCFSEHRIQLGDFKGENNPNWRHGGSESIYCEKFNEDFRKRVREFFDNKCLLCHTSQSKFKRKLGVHHVYYKKSACCENYDDEGNQYVVINEGRGKEVKFYIKGDPNKFAPLCPECHGKTNGHRVEWAQILEDKINNEYGGKSYYTKEEYLELTQ